jgi:hypothetical protein
MTPSLENSPAAEKRRWEGSAEVSNRPVRPGRPQEPRGAAMPLLAEKKKQILQQKYSKNVS